MPIGIIGVFLVEIFWLSKSEKRTRNTLEELKSRTTCAVNATVAEISYRRIKVSRDYNIYYYAVYNIAGYLVKSQVSISRNLFKPGQTVLVYVNPYNYNEIYVPEEKPDRTIRIYHTIKVCLIIGCFTTAILSIIVDYLLLTGGIKMKSKSFQDKFTLTTGIFLILVIVFSIGNTIVDKLTKPIVEVTVLDVDYVMVNENGTIINRADVEYEYEGKYYTANPEIPNNIRTGDKLKFHIDPERPWDQNGFVLYSPIKEVQKVLLFIVGTISLIVIIASKVNKKD